MNQGKLEVVKQEMVRVNIDILGINELKWTGMGVFNSDDHYIYYCGQESLRRNRVAITDNKRVQNAVLGFNLKNNRMIPSPPTRRLHTWANSNAVNTPPVSPWLLAPWELRFRKPTLKGKSMPS